jgi:hypothetical protein
MPRLTLLLTLCGRWPGGATAEARSTRPEGRTCESCLRVLARHADLGVGWNPDWIRKRPGLSWHVLIRDWSDADPNAHRLPGGQAIPQPGVS